MQDFFASDRPVLVVAPHPDDEVLGAGGLMARLADAGRAVHVAVVTRGMAPDFPDSLIETVRAEARRAHAHLGVTETHWLDLPAARLGEVPHGEVNAKIGALVRDVAPGLMLVPHVGDIHLDHQLIFLSSLVAARPHQADYPATILAYETLSETNWNAPYLSPGFLPQVFADITQTIDRKLEAFAMFESQVRAAPHERSIETIRALATLRGGTVHRAACEAFVLIRHAA
ncbi:PIG-L deacetylase family protein [Jannaschia ovalis]|uniref:PIG-L family deacetylase n=1 Tax=Jannaschia ovalis TaxID=3038773 RepID=A0ABY8LDL8_9RHOB|nr:PIG-L family deacetylase [Jannaschia sp. GRR-S6-38]WGH78707.1 PIG-L family deacetylase [Jannaschia sp. GRR-S6-38]